jgi:long-chain fatty acid transport protein
MRRRLGLILLPLAIALLPAIAHATNGYFEHGYGTDSKALAGAGVAMPLGAMSAATNPAAMAFVGNRTDVGLALFSPSRDYTVMGAPSGYPGTFGLLPGKVESGSNAFVIPGVGWNRALGGRQSLGVILFGNGGMNTNYSQPTYDTAPTGVDLMQGFVGVTYARRLDDRNALGITPVLAVQRFRAMGLTIFGDMGLSSDAANLSDNGYASSFGGGVRVGYLGRWLPQLAFGASYQSRTWMSTFDPYQGLFAGQGDFDIPSSWTAGVAVTPHPKVDVLVDVQQIRYSEVKAIGNTMMPAVMNAMYGDAGYRLGTDASPGFGWKDMTVVKGGVQLRAIEGWTLRAGYSYGQQPIPESEVLFNILAPGVIQQHATAGISHALPRGGDLHLAVTHAFSNEITGANVLEAPGQQLIRLRMDEWDVEIGVGF